MRNRPRLFGHHAGARAACVKSLRYALVRALTFNNIRAFSENWKRTQAEVAGLMKPFRRYIQRVAFNVDLLANGVRVRFIGDRVRLTIKPVRPMDELNC
jgi:undecaprenyl diphosphate synthase